MLFSYSFVICEVKKNDMKVTKLYQNLPQATLSFVDEFLQFTCQEENCFKILENQTEHANLTIIRFCKKDTKGNENEFSVKEVEKYCEFMLENVILWPTIDTVTFDKFDLMSSKKGSSLINLLKSRKLIAEKLLEKLITLFKEVEKETKNGYRYLTLEEIQSQLKTTKSTLESILKMGKAQKILSSQTLDNVPIVEFTKGRRVTLD